MNRRQLLLGLLASPFLLLRSQPSGSLPEPKPPVAGMVLRDGRWWSAGQPRADTYSEDYVALEPGEYMYCYTHRITFGSEDERLLREAVERSEKAGKRARGVLWNREDLSS